MQSPKEAWDINGINSWIQAGPELLELQAKKSSCMLPRTFRLGFKAGISVADRDFYEKLKPEYRQN